MYSLYDNSIKSLKNFMIPYDGYSHGIHYFSIKYTWEKGWNVACHCQVGVSSMTPLLRQIKYNCDWFRDIRSKQDSYSYYQSLNKKLCDWTVSCPPYPFVSDEDEKKPDFIKKDNFITVELNMNDRELIYYHDYEKILFYQKDLPKQKYYFYVLYCTFQSQDFQIVQTDVRRLKLFKLKNSNIV